MQSGQRNRNGQVTNVKSCWVYTFCLVYYLGRLLYNLALVLKLCQPSPQGHNQLCFTQACPHLVCECAPRLSEGSSASCFLLPSRCLQVISFLPDHGGSLSIRLLAWWILTVFLSLTLSSRVSLGFVVSCAPSSQGFLWISCFIDFVSM